MKARVNQMSKAALIKRVAELERLHRTEECYVLLGGFMTTRSFWILFRSEMEQKHFPCSKGPFRNFRLAHEWRMKEIQTRYPQGYERFLMLHNQEEIKTKKYLSVDVGVEYAEELAKGVIP